MKLELKENMYVRTKKGNIYKFETNNSMAKNGAKKYMFNCSYNIIDILEVGDYVNGYYVEDVLKTFVNVAVGSNYFQSPTIYEKDIKSIVTKKQFEDMEYRIGE